MQSHNMMNSANNLKAHADRFYAIANKINGSIGHYLTSAGMAGANAAATSKFYPPKKKLLQFDESIFK